MLNNSFFPPWVDLKTHIPGILMSIRFFWHMSLEWASKFLLWSFMDGVTQWAEVITDLPIPGKWICNPHLLNNNCDPTWYRSAIWLWFSWECCLPLIKAATDTKQFADEGSTRCWPSLAWAPHLISPSLVTWWAASSKHGNMVTITHCTSSLSPEQSC